MSFYVSELLATSTKTLFFLPIDFRDCGMEMSKFCICADIDGKSVRTKTDVVLWIKSFNLSL